MNQMQKEPFGVNSLGQAKKEKKKYGEWYLISSTDSDEE